MVAECLKWQVAEYLMRQVAEYLEKNLVRQDLYSLLLPHPACLIGFLKLGFVLENGDYVRNKAAMFYP